MGFLAKEGIRQARLPLPERNRLAQCNLVIETDEKTSSPSGVRMKGLSAEEDYPVLLHAMSPSPSVGTASTESQSRRSWLWLLLFPPKRSSYENLCLKLPEFSKD